VKQHEWRKIKIYEKSLDKRGHLTPTFLFEEKSSLIISIKDFYNYVSPLGADSIFVSVQGNFGWLGGLLFFYFIGLFLSIIEYLSKKNKFLLSYYIGISTLIPFQLFRDNFGIINKQFIWNMLLIPVIIITLNKIAYEMKGAKK
jgi:hypothetical protein